MTLALERGEGGVLYSPASYVCKHPPRQYPDDKAYRLTEEFIAASNWEAPNEVPDPRGWEREPTLAEG